MFQFATVLSSSNYVSCTAGAGSKGCKSVNVTAENIHVCSRAGVFGHAIFAKEYCEESCRNW